MKSVIDPSHLFEYHNVITIRKDCYPIHELKVAIIDVNP